MASIPVHYSENTWITEKKHSRKTGENKIKKKGRKYSLCFLCSNQDFKLVFMYFWTAKNLFCILITQNQKSQEYCEILKVNIA